jgi:hypothetical protein
MEASTLLLILTAVAVPTALWLFERYKRVMADGKLTLGEVLEEGKALLDKAEEVKEAVEDIVEESEKKE